MRLIDADILRKEGWVLHKMVGTTLHEMPLNSPSIPTVDAEPVRHGHWEEIHEVFDYIKCSECGGAWCTEDNDTDTFNYCPNCGAKMDEDEE